MIEKKRQKVNLIKNYYELQAWKEQKVVCGIDEVGRGCLAGPLVTAAVLLPQGKTSNLVKDSKVLTAQERYKASQWIEKYGWVGYGIVDHRTIDTYNIWHATLIAMKRALVNLMTICPLKPASILIDAMPLKLHDTPFNDIPVYHFPKGEKYSISIAAASIMAKIKRDELMAKMDRLFPGYGLAQHKGYSTEQHMNAIKSLNAAIIHRKTFLKSFCQSQHSIEQQSIFEIKPLLQRKIQENEHE